MDNIQDLRKEFENLRKQQEDCEDGSCESEYEEDFPDYMIEITTKMLSPARCGINFSKKDIQAIALECDEKLMIKQRQRMLTDLLKSVFKIEEMEKLFNVIKTITDIKIAQYDELSDEFKSSQSYFKEHKDKALKFKSTLDRILEESRDSFK